MRKRGLVISAAVLVLLVALVAISGDRLFDLLLRLHGGGGSH